MKLFIIMSLLLTSLVSADPEHEQHVHDVAHIGASYMVNTVFYGVYAKGFGMPQGIAIGFSVGATVLTGLTYLYMTNASDGHIGHSMLFNGIGLAGSVITIKTFDF